MAPQRQRQVRRSTEIRPWGHAYLPAAEAARLAFGWGKA
jgi:hypothetical protein